MQKSKVICIVARYFVHILATHAPWDTIGGIFRKFGEYFAKKIGT